MQPRAARRPLDAAHRSLRAARPLQPQAVWCPFGRRAPLTSSHAPFAASSCSATLGRRAPLTSSRVPFAASSCAASPWTPRAAHFEPRALCSLELLGVPLDAARRSLRLRAARPLQPQAARRFLGRRAPFTLSRAPFAASSCSAPLGRRAPLTSSRAPCAASSCSAAPWTPRAAHFEPRALFSLELLGGPLDAARCWIQRTRRWSRAAHLRPHRADRSRNWLLRATLKAALPMQHLVTLPPSAIGHRAPLEEGRAAGSRS